MAIKATREELIKLQRVLMAELCDLEREQLESLRINFNGYDSIRLAILKRSELLERVNFQLSQI